MALFEMTIYTNKYEGFTIADHSIFGVALCHLALSARTLARIFLYI